MGLARRSSDRAVRSGSYCTGLVGLSRGPELAGAADTRRACRREGRTWRPVRRSWFRGSVLCERRMGASSRAKHRVPPRRLHTSRRAACIRDYRWARSSTAFLQRPEVQFLPPQRSTTRPAGLLGRVEWISAPRCRLVTRDVLCRGGRAPLKRIIDRRPAGHRA